MNPTLPSMLLTILIPAIAALCTDDAGEGLQPLFYSQSCPSALATVRSITWNNVAQNPQLAAKLLRLHFHDCFVRGCDASVLIDSTPGNSAEKDAVPNQTLGGFDVIDQIKAAVEEQCPGVVSCADIIALAARDAVSYQYKRPLWPVFTGRRDGNVSLAAEAAAALPKPSSNFSVIQQQFASNGLDIMDLVLLSGSVLRPSSHATFGWLSYHPSLKGRRLGFDPLTASIGKQPSFPSCYSTSDCINQGSVLTHMEPFSSNWYTKISNRKTANSKSQNFCYFLLFTSREPTK